MQVGVDDLDSGRKLEVSGLRLAGALGGEIQGMGTLALYPKDDSLEIEDEVDDVFNHSLDGRELVVYTFDSHRCDGRTGDARQEGTTQGITQRVTETGF
jgi:hypothetical protein